MFGNGLNHRGAMDDFRLTCDMKLKNQFFKTKANFRFMLRVYPILHDAFF